jgi:hypothetical protein
MLLASHRRRWFNKPLKIRTGLAEALALLLIGNLRPRGILVGKAAI